MYILPSCHNSYQAYLLRIYEYYAFPSAEISATCESCFSYPLDNITPYGFYNTNELLLVFCDFNVYSKHKLCALFCMIIIIETPSNMRILVRKVYIIIMPSSDLAWTE